MTDALHRTLTRQLDTAWMLTSYHLDGLTTDECLWRPAAQGLHVRQDDAGRWVADWPEHEGYDLGPPSIAWTTWHILFWWSSVLDYSFGEGALTRHDVFWPGSADVVRAAITTLHDTWRLRVDALSAHELQETTRTRWPFTDRPFADVVAWANIELTKNAAEIGYARFLHGVRDR
jgi:DinB superfamily